MSKLLYSLLAVAAFLSASAQAGEFGCIVCQKAAAAIKEQLHNPDIAAQVHQVIEQLCSQLEDPERENCTNSLESIVDQVKNSSPLKFCQDIQLCQSSPGSSTSETQLAKLVTEIIKPAIKALSAGPTECALCRSLAKEVIEALKDEKNSQAVRDGLVKICSIIRKDPKEIKQCEEIVDAYALEFIKVITEQDPLVICTVLGQCVDLDEFRDKPLCDKCKHTVSDLKHEALKPEVIAKAHEIGDQLCESSEQPSDVEQCKKVIREKIDATVEKIRKIHPARLCTQIHLC